MKEESRKSWTKFEGGRCLYGLGRLCFATAMVSYQL